MSVRVPGPRPIATTSPPARPSSPSAAGTSTWVGTGPTRARPNTPASSPSGSQTAAGCPGPGRLHRQRAHGRLCPARRRLTYTVQPSRGNIRLALKPLKQLYGHTLAAEFGPLALKAVRQACVDAGLCRAEINKRTRRVVRLFKWARRGGARPASVHHALQAVAGSAGAARRSGRARRSGPCPTPWSTPSAPRLPAGLGDDRAPAAHRHAARRGCQMRTCDLDTRAGLGVPAGPQDRAPRQGPGDPPRPPGAGQSQALAPGRARPPTSSSPARRSPERRAEMRARAQDAGPTLPAEPQEGEAEEVTRRPLHDRQLPPGDRVRGERAGKAGVETWHPHQLRHSAATRIRREFGLDVARAVLGHSSPVVTEVYAELDQVKAAEAMGKIG